MSWRNPNAETKKNSLSADLITAGAVEALRVLKKLQAEKEARLVSAIVLVVLYLLQRRLYYVAKA